MICCLHNPTLEFHPILSSSIVTPQSEAAYAFRPSLAQRARTSVVQAGVDGMHNCLHHKPPQYLTGYCIPVSDVASRRHRFLWWLCLDTVSASMGVGHLLS